MKYKDKNKELAEYIMDTPWVMNYWRSFYNSVVVRFHQKYKLSEGYKLVVNVQIQAVKKDYENEGKF